MGTKVVVCHWTMTSQGHSLVAGETQQKQRNGEPCNEKSMNLHSWPDGKASRSLVCSSSFSLAERYRAKPSMHKAIVKFIAWNYICERSQRLNRLCLNVISCCRWRELDRGYSNAPDVRDSHSPVATAINDKVPWTKKNVWPLAPFLFY